MRSITSSKIYFITHEFPCEITYGDIFYLGGRGHGINFDLSYEIENSSSNYRKSVFTACFTRLIIHTAENTFQNTFPLATNLNRVRFHYELRHTLCPICHDPYLHASEDPTRVSSCVSSFYYAYAYRHACNFDIEKNKIEDSSCVKYTYIFLYNINVSLKIK